MGTETKGNQSKDLDRLIEVWEKVVDLQMHFNEMCMGLRRTAVSVLGVLLASGAIAFRFGGQVLIYEQEVSVAFLFVAVAILVWVSFYLVDRFWYHQLLRSAVSYTESLTKPARCAGLSFELDVSQKIREQNHSSLGLSGGAKINWFYGIIAATLVLAEIALYFGAISPVPVPQ